jgi:site-specific recombinase XerD
MPSSPTANIKRQSSSTSRPPSSPRTNCAYVQSTSFEDRRDTAIIGPFVDAGIRLAELTALTMDDAAFDMRVAHVFEKGRRPRPCPFGAKTAKAVNAYLRAHYRYPVAHSPASWLRRKNALTSSRVTRVVPPQSPRRKTDSVMEQSPPGPFLGLRANVTMHVDRPRQRSP